MYDKIGGVEMFVVQLEWAIYKRFLSSLPFHFIGNRVRKYSLSKSSIITHLWLFELRERFLIGCVTVVNYRKKFLKNV